MRRNTTFAPGEYYHLLGRGNYKQKVFLGREDYERFLFLILYFQSPVVFTNIGRQMTDFVQYRMSSRILDVVKGRFVELINFCLMPNHFHLTVREVKEGGISLYMQRSLNSFTKYHNAKYDKKGHLFEGPFKAVHIKTNRQLLHLSAYIHRNPRELRKWHRNEHRYPWSSYQDYINVNRWSELLVPGVVLKQFDNTEGYRDFVKTSKAKKKEHEELNIDDWYREI